MNVNLGDLAKGCYRIPLGQTEQRDVGFWTVTMSVDSPVPFFQASLISNPPKVSFTVSAVPEFPIPALVMGIVLVGASFMVRFGIRQKEDIP
jgi:hypothetical protein